VAGKACKELNFPQEPSFSRIALNNGWEIAEKLRGPLSRREMVALRDRFEFPAKMTVLNGLPTEWTRKKRRNKAPPPISYFGTVLY
jgi:hypothetical protein